MTTQLSMSLAGRVAVVTGGSRGLGRAIVRGLAEAGADVVVASRKLDACEEVAQEVEQAGRRALAVACHVGDWEQVTRLVDVAHAHFGQLDVLVNNAGMSPQYDHPIDVSEQLYDKVLAVNLKGPFRLMAAAGTRMVEGGGGSIVNISSIGAFRPTANILPYSAAKAGLNALTQGFAQAFAPTVRVNCVVPGAFLSDVSSAWTDEGTASRARAAALGRCGTPEEVVGAVLYFATEASSYTTGAVLRVDGGVL